MDFRKNIKLLIFDFDGTLHTLAIDWLKMRQVAGIADMQESLGDALERLMREKDEEALEKITRLEAESIENQILDATIKKTLDKLSDHFQIAILSRNSGRVIRHFLTKGGISGIYIIGREGVSKLKPDPEGIDKILKHFGRKPEEVVLIGDTSHDVEAAYFAGIASIIVGNNYQPSPNIKPSYHLDKLAELPALLGPDIVRRVNEG